MKRARRARSVACEPWLWTKIAFVCIGTLIRVDCTLSCQAPVVLNGSTCTGDNIIFQGFSGPALLGFFSPLFHVDFVVCKFWPFIKMYQSINYVS